MCFSLPFYILSVRLKLNSAAKIVSEGETPRPAVLGSCWSMCGLVLPRCLISTLLTPGIEHADVTLLLFSKSSSVK